MREREQKPPRGIIVRDGDHGLPYSKEIGRASCRERV